VKAYLREYGWELRLLHRAGYKLAETTGELTPLQRQVVLFMEAKDRW